MDIQSRQYKVARLRQIEEKYSKGGVTFGEWSEANKLAMELYPGPKNEKMTGRCIGCGTHIDMSYGELYCIECHYDSLR